MHCVVKFVQDRVKFSKPISLLKWKKWKVLPRAEIFETVINAYLANSATFEFYNLICFTNQNAFLRHYCDFLMKNLIGRC